MTYIGVYMYLQGSKISRIIIRMFSKTFQLNNYIWIYFCTLHSNFSDLNEMLY